MFQSVIITDPKSEIKGKQGVNCLIVAPIIDKGKVKDIGIDTVRQTIGWLTKTAFNQDHRYVVIEQAHHLTEQAQQALLKTLEEPPDDATLILCPQQASQLLITIRSRCLQQSLSPSWSEQWAAQGWPLLYQPTPQPKATLPLTDILAMPAWQQLDTLAGLAKDKTAALTAIEQWLEQCRHLLTSQPNHLPQWLILVPLLQTAQTDLQGNGNPRLSLLNVALSLPLIKDKA